MSLISAIAENGLLKYYNKYTIISNWSMNDDDQDTDYNNNDDDVNNNNDTFKRKIMEK